MYSLISSLAGKEQKLAITSRHSFLDIKQSLQCSRKMISRYLSVGSLLVFKTGTFQSNDGFFALGSSQIDDTSECLIVRIYFTSVFATSPCYYCLNNYSRNSRRWHQHVAMPQFFYDRDKHAGDILAGFSLVKNDIILGSKDSKISLNDTRLVVSACMSPDSDYFSLRINLPPKLCKTTVLLRFQERCPNTNAL